MIYIHRRNGFWEIGQELPDSYRVGTTLEEYEQGAYLLLDAEQEAFKREHANATQLEAWNKAMYVPPEPTPEEKLEQARQRKISEIYEQDRNSEKFFILEKEGGEEKGNYQMWLDKDLRNSLYSMTIPALEYDGEQYVTLWSGDNGVSVPTGWAKDKIQLLEIYAKKTYDRRAELEKAANAATTVEEVEAIDITEGYPKILTFEYNKDLNG